MIDIQGLRTCFSLIQVLFLNITYLQRAGEHICFFSMLNLLDVLNYSQSWSIHSSNFFAFQTSHLQTTVPNRAAQLPTAEDCSYTGLLQDGKQCNCRNINMRLFACVLSKLPFTLWFTSVSQTHADSNTACIRNVFIDNLWSRWSRKVIRRFVIFRQLWLIWCQKTKPKQNQKQTGGFVQDIYLYFFHCLNIALTAAKHFFKLHYK